MKLRLALSSNDNRLLDSAVKSVVVAVSPHSKGVIAIPIPSRNGLSKRMIEIKGATSNIVDILTKLYITKSVHITIL